MTERRSKVYYLIHYVGTTILFTMVSSSPINTVPSSFIFPLIFTPPAIGFSLYFHATHILCPNRVRRIYIGAGVICQLLLYSIYMIILSPPQLSRELQCHKLDM